MELLDGKYQIEQLLGEGGMGSVYRATHLGTKRTVAVKVISSQLSANHEFVARFQREAEAAGRLRHPNVVDVTDFGFAQTANGPVAYLVMEYLDGCSLAEIVKEEGILPTSWVVDILEQVCAAVETAHRAGIIHRDLKPDNIWLEPNGRGGYTVKVLDFGLVKLAERVDHGQQHRTRTSAPRLSPNITEAETFIRSEAEDQTQILPARTSELLGSTQPATNTNYENLTRVGSVMGTPFYMSPEQCRGEVLDARSDIYSLGVISYRLLTGRTPFSGAITELMEQHKTSEPTPIRKQNRKVSKKLAAIVMSALAKDPADRPRSAAGFASALRSAWEGPGHLLRHAFALYSEHFPTFFKIALPAYIPLLIVLGFTILSGRMVEQMDQIAMLKVAIALFVGMIASLLFAFFVITAATVPVVVQLTLAPLRPVRVRTAITALRRRWRVFLITSVIVMLMILTGSVLFILPGLVVAILFALYAPVAIMENHGVMETLRRSKSLSRRAVLTVLITTLLQFVLPALVWRASVISHFELQLGPDWAPKQFGFNFAMSGTSMAYQLLNVFVTPLSAIMVSLLYLKTRKAGGESLEDASEKFEAIDLPRSKWQARMRSRSRTTGNIDVSTTSR
ncbi:MAG TPA: serine/threonine-protein kinase [Pyrinomonadaceae bacterium]